MSWHLVFQFSSPHSSTPSLPLRAHTGSSSSRLLFFSVQCSSRWRSQCFEKGPRGKKEKKKDQVAMYFFFLFFFDNRSISHSLSPVFRARGVRSARGGANVEQCGRSNNGANKRKNFAQVGVCRPGPTLKKKKDKRLQKKANLAFQFKRKNSFNQEPPS